ncbi:MAG TPA: GNAT family N-acetyltransferase [Gaiellaceae bacterium]|nr:GNAT family N-acetyltransferase [Gaiellaceae bacterium]
MDLEYRTPTADELPTALRAVYAAFGEEAKEDDLQRDLERMPGERVLTAWDGGRPVGTTASYPFELTVPGGHARAAGVTWVGVLPSHRRRGILRELMRRQLEDVRERGEPLAILWASESAIYGRFGYGPAAPATRMEADRAAFALREDAGPRGRVRLLETDEAAEVLPPLYERIGGARAGMLRRSPEWWRLGRLADPKHWRDGAGPKFVALLELDGGPAGYALYRIASKWEGGVPQGEVRVLEALAVSAEATRELWRFLFGIDLVARVVLELADPAWPLFLMVRDPRRLHLSVSDGLWLRLVDVEAALRARAFADAPQAVLGVADDVLPGNAGRYAVGREASRTEAEPDVALHAADLASAYLGAFSFEQLAAAGRARELRPGGLARASALFATPLPPYCPEGF